MGNFKQIFVRPFAKRAIKSGWFRWETVELTLVSGRKFRYQMRDYPFRAFATEWKLDELCCKLIKDKYRYCEWDRASEDKRRSRDFDAVKKWMMYWVAKALELRAESEAQAESGTVPDPTV